MKKRSLIGTSTVLVTMLIMIVFIFKQNAAQHALKDHAFLHSWSLAALEFHSVLHVPAGPFSISTALAMDECTK